MKLLIITAVNEFEAAIKKMLFDAGIEEFTCAPVTGCRDASMESAGDNWFASEVNETGFMLFWVFAAEHSADSILTAAGHFNKGQESQSRIHLAVLPIEKHI